ncbi:uncharacterized protein LOC124940445 [Impatiens glandulifera]|uniref:uncharacterized protein LOC124940445 n=1 Tax=Impatiens glandulifera TaxID=253017 RepID=UPI001FB0D4A5|nr:uncharacterized protein LOC124940445 [Impatiens glandulifera]
MILKPESPETKAFVIKETGVTSVSKPAFQAFKLLSENPAAQSVVASIASDPNVWLAVMENPDLKEYLYSQKSTASDSVLEKECVSEVKFQDNEAHESVNDRAKSGDGLFHNIKTRVVDMLSGLSGYFQNIFGGGEETNADVEDSAKTKTSFMENPLGASFMGLAVMVILVVVLKRP